MWAIAALAMISTLSSVATTPCELARNRCAYRSGCGSALSNYMVLCNDVLAGAVPDCPQRCEHALIALTSAVEGKELMNCKCEDEYCLEAKKRIEVCRPSVVKGAANATASCRLSQLICEADSQCAIALVYYNRLCKSMFRGKKCSKRCLNSIEILKKQAKAASLTNCQCDGNEDFDCPQMQSNLARLCYHKHKNHTNTHDKGSKHHKNQTVRVSSASSVKTFSAMLTFVAFAFSVS